MKARWRMHANGPGGRMALAPTLSTWTILEDDEAQSRP
jgi:hypothetical protein